MKHLVGMHHEALRGVKPDSVLNVDVPPHHWVEEVLCPEESFCSGGWFFTRTGCVFWHPLSADVGDSLDESLSVDEGCSHHEARSPAQMRSSGEVCPFQAEEDCSLVYSHAGNPRWAVVVDLRGSQEPCTVLRPGWPRRPRAL